MASLTAKQRAAARAARHKRAKALRKSLEGAVSAAASKLGTSAPTFNGTGKTCEAWAMFEIAGQLAAARYPVAPKTHAGKTPRGRFRIRGGPGHIQKRDEKGALPCYFEIGWPGRTLELHNSLVHLGDTGEGHELDLSILWGFVVEDHRDNGGPYKGPRLCGAELKAFDEQATLDKNIARALVAVVLDLDANKIVKVGQSATPPTLPQYALITTALISEASERYLESYGILAGPRTGPGASGAITKLLQDAKLL